jgi:hypothetical protein
VTTSLSRDGVEPTAQILRLPHAGPGHNHHPRQPGWHGSSTAHTSDGGVAFSQVKAR